MIQKVFLILGVIFIFHCGKPERELINDAIEHRAAGQYAEAESILRNLLKKSENEVIYKELGNVYLLGLNNLDEAEKFYLRSLQINPSYINSLHNMGLLYINRYENSQDNKGNGNDAFLNKAHQFLEKSLNINKQFLLSRQELAKYYFYKGDYKTAIEEIEEAIGQDSRNSRGYSIAGQIYLKGIGNAKKALMYFEEAYALNREDTDILLLLARTNKMLNENEESEMLMKEFELVMKRKGFTEEDIRKIAASQALGFKKRK